jgi:hypothetical protein
VQYPCTDLGPLTLHVHPHFAIINSAKKILKHPDEFEPNALKILQAHDSIVREKPYMVEIPMFDTVNLHNKWLSKRFSSKAYEYLPNGSQRHGEEGGDRRTQPSRSSRSKTSNRERSSSGSAHSSSISVTREVAEGAQVELANPGLTPDSTDEDDDHLGEDDVEIEQTARIESWRTEVAKSAPEGL